MKAATKAAQLRAQAKALAHHADLLERETFNKIESGELKEGEETCWDCGVKPGELHHWGCEVECCPWCGGQVISCVCFRATDLNLAEWGTIVTKGGRLPYGHARERAFWCGDS